MIQSEVEKTLISSNVGNKTTYKILANSKMMNILSNNIYSNKVRAVLRELSTNAYDAHITAKCADKPFDVYLPSSLKDNIFKIRDYGTGLSKEDVERLYSTYGSSDKTSSNEFVGFMGLGSKSPFALVSQFTTISYFNGKKYTFFNFKNEEDIPTLSMVSEQDTNEPNGLEISFIVNNTTDINFFKEEINFVYAPFDIKPNIYIVDQSNWLTDSKKVKLQSSIEVIEKNNYKFYFYNTEKKDHYYNANNNILAKMGNVLYEITDHTFFNVIKSDSNYISKLYYFLKNLPYNQYLSTEKIQLVINFPIGAIDIATSREAVQLTPRTAKAITLWMEEFFSIRGSDIISVKEDKNLSIFDKKIKLLDFPEREICSRYQSNCILFNKSLLSSDFVDQQSQIKFESKSNLKTITPSDNDIKDLKFFPNKLFGCHKFIRYFSKNYFDLRFTYTQYGNWLKENITQERRTICILIKDQSLYTNQVNELLLVYPCVVVVNTKEDAENIKSKIENINFSFLEIKYASKIKVTPKPKEQKTKKEPEKRGFVVLDPTVGVAVEKKDDPNIFFSKKKVYYLVKSINDYYDNFVDCKRIGTCNDINWYLKNSFTELIKFLCAENKTDPKSVHKEILLLTPVLGKSFIDKYPTINFVNLSEEMEKFSELRQQYTTIYNNISATIGHEILLINKNNPKISQKIFETIKLKHNNQSDIVSINLIENYINDFYKNFNYNFMNFLFGCGFWRLKDPVKLAKILKDYGSTLNHVNAKIIQDFSSLCSSYEQMKNNISRFKIKQSNFDEFFIENISSILA